MFFSVGIFCLGKAASPPTFLFAGPPVCHNLNVGYVAKRCECCPPFLLFATLSTQDKQTVVCTFIVHVYVVVSFSLLRTIAKFDRSPIDSANALTCVGGTKFLCKFLIKHRFLAQHFPHVLFIYLFIYLAYSLHGTTYSAINVSRK